MANGASETVTTAGKTVWSDTAGCAAFGVVCLPTSSNPCFVQIVGIHDLTDASDGFPLGVGMGWVFRKGYAGIKGAKVTGVGGNAAIGWTVTSLTPIESVGASDIENS